MMRKSERGYSLAEMLTVVAIVGILALVTVPAFITFRNSNKVKTSVRNFTTSLRKVRQAAITNGVQSKLTFKTGTAGTRQYDFWLGNVAVGTPTWTPLTAGMGSGTAAAEGYTRTLDDTVYFPVHGTSTPQTFTDIDQDGTLDVVFFPDGRVLMPNNQTTATISLQTDMNVYQKVFQVEVTPSGRIQVR